MISSENAFLLLNKLQHHKTEAEASLLQELRSYQIELVLQNEELRTVQAELEASRDRYSNLYDIAPIGYFVIDEKGVIQEANETGAAMLAVEKSNLSGQKFSKFIPPEYQDAFYFHRKKVFETGKRQQCRLKLLMENGRYLYVRMASIASPEMSGDTRRFRTGIMDIGEKEKAVSLEKSWNKRNFLSSCLMTVQEEERKKIALELHDDLGQSIVLLILRLRDARSKLPITGSEFASECDHMDRLATGMLNTVRRISRGLTPRTPDNFSLTDMLRRLADDFIRYADLPISLDIENMDNMFSTRTQVAIYRIFQEALTNAVKHAAAKHITIGGWKREDGSALFRITDEGKGFDVKAEKNGRFDGESGFGLASMENRVIMLNGRFKIESALSKGTQITFRIPFEPAASVMQKKPSGSGVANF